MLNGLPWKLTEINLSVSFEVAFEVAPTSVDCEGYHFFYGILAQSSNLVHSDRYKGCRV